MGDVIPASDLLVYQSVFGFKGEMCFFVLIAHLKKAFRLDYVGDSQ